MKFSTIFNYCLLFAFLSSCGLLGEEDEPVALADKVDPKQNSFSCVINGVEYIPKTSFATIPPSPNTPVYQISGIEGEDRFSGPSEGIRITLPETIKVGLFVLDDTVYSNGNAIDFPVNFAIVYYGDDTSLSSKDGEVNITEFGNGRIAGTFEFVTEQDTITNGLFDLQLLER